MTRDEITYVDRYISNGNKQSLSLKNIYDTILVGDANDPSHIYRVAIDDFFLKHRNDLVGIEKYYEIPQEMFYKPKILSLQMYGTTELWLAILRLNNMRNVTEFHKPYIRLYDPDKLLEIIRIHFKREGKI